MFSIGDAPWSRDALIEAMPEFLRVWRRRPWDKNPGGMGATHMFFMWFAVRQLDPQYIVESGVWHGAGTWMLEQAAPAAKLFCLDPLQRDSIYTSPRAHYQKKDFNETVWDALDKERTLLFFDDHQGCQRIQQAAAFGFVHAMYEDNYPVYYDAELSVKAALAQQAEMAEWLMANIETYYEFPPIFANRTKHAYPYARYKHVTHPPLFAKPDSAFQPFVDDALGYYYMAYLKIKKADHEGDP